MSVLAGIRYFDGKEPSRQEVGFLLDELEARGPDYANIFISRRLGMGFRGFLVAPELLSVTTEAKIAVFRTPMITMKFINAATIALEMDFSPTVTE